jgi:hypothetical protein
VLFTLTGTSCAGKTTITDLLKRRDDLVVYDFDEDGVPDLPDTVWRQRTLEHWVQRALENQANGMDTLLSAPSPLGEVLAVPSAPKLDGIAVALIDVTDRVRWARLEERSPGVLNAEGKRLILEWARWHRGHAKNPRHNPGFITTDAAPEMEWSRWSSWRKGDPRWVTKTVETTTQTIEESTAEVERWLDTERAGHAASDLAGSLDT